MRVECYGLVGRQKNRVIALKDAGQTDEVYGHSELRISFDIKWLFSGQARHE